MSGAELHTLLTDTTQAIEQAHDILGDAEKLDLEPSPPVSAKSNPTLRDLSAAAAFLLRGFANDVEHNPQLLF